MKQLKYNNQMRLLLSGEMLAILNSSTKMLQRDLMHTNKGQLFRYLLVQKLEETYTKKELEKNFDWSSIPEVQEYEFAQQGGHEIESRHYRRKLADRLKEYYDKRRKGEDLTGYEDLSQIELPFDNSI